MVVDQRKNAIVALYKGGAALDTIAAVVVRDVAELADASAVYVAAKDRINTVAFRIMRHSGFEFADKAHRIFHTPLGISADDQPRPKRRLTKLMSGLSESKNW